MATFQNKRSTESLIAIIVIILIPIVIVTGVIIYGKMKMDSNPDIVKEFED